MSQKKTRILICGILPPPYFGHSVMYKMLMESSFPRHLDIVFLNMHFWTYGQHKKVTPVKLLKMGWYLMKYIWLLIIKRPKYVLYNMSFDKMPFLKDFLFCSIGKMFGAGIIIHDMGQYIRELYDSSSPFMKRMVKRFAKMATASVIMGNHTKSVYEGFMDESQLFVVPGCVEDSKGMAEDYLIAEKDSSKITVLYFSYLSESKGARVAFEAVRQVLEKKEDVCFQFAGPLESESIGQELDQLVAENPGRVEYLGYVDDADKRTKLFRGADVFIFPTQRDVFGLVLLHALAEGVSIVSTKEGNIPDIVEDGVNGVLVEKGSSEQLARGIIDLAGSDVRRAEMVPVNREKYIREYTVEVFGERMVKIFQQLDKDGV